MRPFLAWMLLCCTLVAQSTFYVSTTGSDSNPGTQGSPFLTPGHAISVASASDTININSGTYTTAATLQITISSLTIRTTPGDPSKAIITGGAGTHDLFLLTDVSNVRIENLELREGDAGIVVTGTVNDNLFVNLKNDATPTGTAITFIGSGSTGSGNMVINPDFIDDGDAGVDGISAFGSVEVTCWGGYLRGFTGAGSDALTTHESAMIHTDFGVWEGVFYDGTRIEDCDDGVHHTNTNNTSRINGLYVQDCVDSGVKHDGGGSPGGDGRVIVTNSVLISSSSTPAATTAAAKVVNYGRMTVVHSTLVNANTASGTNWSFYSTSNNSSYGIIGCVFTGDTTNDGKYIRFVDNTYVTVEELDRNTYLPKTGTEFNAGASVDFAAIQVAGFEANGQVSDPLLAGDPATDRANAELGASSPALAFVTNLVATYPELDGDALGRGRPLVGTNLAGGALQRQVSTKIIFTSNPVTPTAVSSPWGSFAVSVVDAGDVVIPYEDQQLTLSLSVGAGALSGDLVVETTNGVGTFTGISYDVAETLTISVVGQFFVTPITFQVTTVGMATVFQKSLTATSGTLVIYGGSYGAGRSDMMINATSITGDTTKRIEIIGGWVGSPGNSTAFSITSDVRSSQVYLDVGVGERVTLESVKGNSGENIYLQVESSVGGSLFYGEITWREVAGSSSSTDVTVVE